MDRRDFLKLGGAALGSLALSGCNTGRVAEDSVATLPANGGAGRKPRGVVIVTSDLTLDWPGRAAAAGLDTIALHSPADPSVDVIKLITAADGSGAAFLDRCAALSIDVEYEMHCMDYLLPLDLFATRPELFRTAADCQRVAGNLCVHQPDALAIAADNAIALSRILRPTTGRYFLWPEDGADWCLCPCCAPLSFSDQQLVMENYLLTALRSEDPNATIAHLAYLQTLAPPSEVTPLPGVFLEFAPINRRYDIPLDTPSDPTQKTYLKALAENLAVFGAQGAKALEYWLDVSRASSWQKPDRQLSFDSTLVAADVATYQSLGVENISTFAVWFDADYVSQFGDSVIAEYGADVGTGGVAP